MPTICANAFGRENEDVTKRLEKVTLSCGNLASPYFSSKSDKSMDLYTYCKYKDFAVCPTRREGRHARTLGS